MQPFKKLKFRKLFPYFFALVFLSFVSCFDGGSSSSRGKGPGPSADAEIITGVLNVQNARLLCSFKEHSGQNYLVTCRAAYADPSGTSIPADSLAEGISLAWKEPKRIAGAEIQSAVCNLVASSLTQECRISLTGTVPDSEIEFGFDVTDQATSRAENAIVHLPYSIKTYGFAPQLPAYFSTESSDPEKMRYQYRTFGAMETQFGRINSACEMGGRIFFSSYSQVYVLENGVVRLFAGSGNRKNYNEFSHPLRTYFGDSSGIHLACGKNSIYVATRGVNQSTFYQNRFFRITDSSIVLIPLKKLPGIDPSLSESDPLFNVSSFIIENDSTLYLTSAINRIVRIELPSSSGAGFSQILASGLDAPGSIARGPDASLYFTESMGTRIRKLSKEGVVSTLYSFPGPLFWPNQCGIDQRMHVYPDGSVLMPNTGSLPPTRIDATGNSAPYPFTFPGGEKPSYCSFIPTSSGELLMTSLFSVWRLPVSGQGILLLGRNMDESTSVQKHAFGSVPSVLAGEEGSLYLLDSSSLKIRKVDKTGKGTIVARLPQLLNILSFTRTPDGSFYLVHGSLGLFKVDTTGTVTQICSSDLNGSGDGGPVTQATLAGPYFITSDNTGNLYISEQNVPRIRKINSNGIIETLASGLHNPGALTLDDQNRLLFVDGPTIKQVDLQTGTVTHIAGNTSLGQLARMTSGDLALDEPLNPLSLAYSPRDKRIYLTDSRENAIHYLAPETHNGGTRYRIYTFYGANEQKDCGSGVIQGETTAATMENQLRTSLASVCGGSLQGIAIQSNCSSSGGKFNLVFSQTYGTLNGSVVVHAQSSCSP